jgi:outer membrane protein assembly factor BamB
MIVLSQNVNRETFPFFSRRAVPICVKAQRAFFSALFVSLLLTVGLVPAGQASNVPFQTGDVLVSVSTPPETVLHFSAQNELLDTLPTGGSGFFMGGMAFDAAGNLYATTFDGGNIFEFDHRGNLLGAFGSGFNGVAVSIVFDSSGNAYVGQGDILKLSSTGVFLGTFGAQMGAGWIDLASDQCTIFYASSDGSVKRFNVCTNTQLPDFATGLGGGCFGLRIRPNSEVLVACVGMVYRLDSSGNVIQIYHTSSQLFLFALSLDPDNKTIWIADQRQDLITRVDIASGQRVGAIGVPHPFGDLGVVDGVSVVGELTAAVPDLTPPVIAGMPPAGCTLSPPNHKLVQVATITASDNKMVEPGSFQVTATSNEPPSDPTSPDIVITPTPSGAFTVELRAERSGKGAGGRIYTINATASDTVGNVATVTASCTVPHDQGH